VNAQNSDRELGKDVTVISTQHYKPTAMIPTILRTCMVLACFSTASGAELVRVWPTAVITGDNITLADVCDLSLLTAARSRDDIDTAVVATAPRPGGSNYVTVDQVQQALRRAGVNLATVLVSGSTRCAVSRPRTAVPSAPSTKRHPAHVDARPSASETARRTLRDAVVGAFQQRVPSRGGVVELQFGRTSPQILELSEPRYSFRVTIVGGRWLGRMINVDVDVFSDGQDAQTIHLVANASLLRSVVVAKRPINQKEKVSAADVEVIERIFDQVDTTIATAIDAVVGQRAKRFIAPGAVVKVTDLELVPLVRRGQIVSVRSLVGGVEVRSAAKALDNGRLGDVVELRTGGRKGEVLTGIVIGERRVMIGLPPSPVAQAASLAMGGGS